MAKNPWASKNPAGPLTETIKAKLTESRTIDPPNEKTFYRGSGLASICPREEVLAAVHKIVRKESFDANALLTFALGTGIHVALQEVILPNVGALIGEWACLGCGEHYGRSQPFDIQDMIYRPSSCFKCGDKEFRYVEQYFRDETYRITGHPDGFLEIPGKEGIGLLEAKSIGPRGAAEVKKVPKFEHVVQAQIYLWFTGLTWACILYWDKGVYGSDCFIEHIVERDEDTIEAVQTALLSIREGIKTGELPARICASPSAPRAMSCACAKQCFAEEK